MNTPLLAPRDQVSRFYDDPTPAGAVALARSDHEAANGGIGMATFVYQLNRAEAICKLHAELLETLNALRSNIDVSTINRSKRSAARWGELAERAESVLARAVQS